MTLSDFLCDWRNDNDCVMVHTSGSTGKPKPMWVEKRRMLNSARITCDFLGLKAGDTALLCMPLDYIAGKMLVVRCLERGMRLINVKPCRLPLKDVTEDITFAAMVPLQVHASLEVPVEREKLMRIKHLIIGGGAVDADMQRQLNDFPNAVWSTYGMTETLSHIALRRLNGPEASEWYTPFESVEVSCGTDGCLVIDAPLVHDGRLETNDIVELRGRQFRVLGRKDNVIDSGGIKIQAEEVEKKLQPYLDLPFMITKCKDAEFGEVVVMLTEATDMERIKKICRDRLPKYWMPRKFVHTDKLPVTETGKPARALAAAVIIDN